MSNILRVIWALPRSIRFNFAHLPLRQAIHLPILLAGNVRIRTCKGRIILQDEHPTRASVRIGFHRVHVIDEWSAHTILSLDKGSVWTIKGTTYIGQGSKIVLRSNAQLSTGNNFFVSGRSDIVCYQSIMYGDDVQYSWDCLTVDSDSHQVFDQDGCHTNPDQPIVVGNKVWIGCRCTILKGSQIANNTVVGSGSLICKKHTEGDCVLAGSPAMKVKGISSFSL